MKKVKVYGYFDAYRDEEFGDWCVNLLPTLEVRHDWMKRGKGLYILVGWLLWGVTLDIRWGRWVE